MNDRLEALHGYFDLMNANGAARVYRVAIESGILDALRDGPATAEKLAATLVLEQRPCALVLRALAAMKVVENSDAGYRLTALGTSLVGGSYRNLGDEYWSHLPELVRTGQPIVRMDDAAERATHYQTQAAALAWMLAPAAKLAASKIGGGASLSNQAILDLGAGSGIWSLTMAELDDGARVTVVDWPAVLPVAESHARQLGLAIRLDTIAGNYHEVELPHSAFDIAILGNVTHLETPDGNAHLMNRASEALRPGGVLLVFDVLPSRDEGRLNAALYELGLALRTASGRVYSAAELTAFMEGAGLRSVELLELEVPPFAVGMLKATKPVTGRSGHHAGRA